MEHGRGWMQMMRPRERDLLDLLERGAENVVRAADLLDELLHRHPDAGELPNELVRCEQLAHRLLRDTAARLHGTFVTPIEAGDIHALALAQDAIVDGAEKVGDYLTVYRLGPCSPAVRRLGRLLLDGSRLMSDAVPRMNAFKSVELQARGIDRVGRDGQRIAREARAALFVEHDDPLVVLGWKDVIEGLAGAIERLTASSAVVQGVVDRHG